MVQCFDCHEKNEHKRQNTPEKHCKKQFKVFEWTLDDKRWQNYKRIL